MSKPLCQHCGKPLRAIGTARKGGVQHHDDWANRKNHKKCFKMLRRAGRIGPTRRPRQRGPF